MKKELLFGITLVAALALLLIWNTKQYTDLTGSIFPSSTPPIVDNSSGGQNQLPADIKLDVATVAQHNKTSDCWIIISNNVYSVTKFLVLHPGGAGQIIPFCGKDATSAFQTKSGQGQHSSLAYSQLSSYLIGPLNSSVTETRIESATQNTDLPAGSSPSPTTPPPPAPSPTNVKLDLATVATHNKSSDCWIIVSGNVYTVTSYIPVHPGGANQIIPLCGKDATTAFQTQGGGGQHSNFASTQLASYLLGPLDSTVNQQQITDTATNTTPPPGTNGGNEDEWEDD